MTQIFQTLLTMAVVVGMALAAPTPEISEPRNVSLGNVSSSTVASTSSNNGLVSSTEVAHVGLIGAKEFTSTAVPKKTVTGRNVNGGKPELPQCHGGVGDNGCGFFDKIFAISIKIWQAINKYLNTKQTGHAAGAPYEQNSNGTSEKANYNEIFNIPIAAFRYVKNMFRDGGAGWMIWKNFKTNISGVN